MFCSCNLDFLRFTTDVRDSDCRVLGNVKGEITIYIGNSTDVVPFTTMLAPIIGNLSASAITVPGNFDVLRIYLVRI